MPVINVEIIDVAFGGDGVARHEGKVVFVPGTLPGERVDVSITADAKRFSRGLPVAVTEASPDRIENNCPYSLIPSPKISASTYCAGCAYRHCSYEAELSLKKKQLADLLQRIAKLESSPSFEIEPSPLSDRYRNKISLHQAQAGAGYFSADNKTVIPISDCLLAHEQIGAEIGKAETSADKDADIVFRFTEADGIKTWHTPLPSKPTLTESTSVGNIRVPPSSFSQVNPAVSSLLVNYVTEVAQGVQPDSLIDIYCGVGLFAISAAQAGVPDVFGVEIDESAVACATENARNLCPGHANFICSSAAPGLKTVIGALRNLRNSVVIVDPPRRGLEPALMTVLKRSEPKLLIYISCAADKLARDIRELAIGGYSIESMRLFDMFPRTASFETVAVFRKKL